MYKAQLPDKNTDTISQREVSHRKEHQNKKKSKINN